MCDWVFVLSLVLQSSSPESPQATTYYVRPDGGTAGQCTGKVDAPYPGSGSKQPCAWNHPFQALPPDGKPRIKGGDTLIIKKGSYRMGLGAPGAGECYQAGSYDCVMPAIPSGPDASRPTRILGEGWNAGCTNPPELWGAERPWYVVNLTDSSNVEIGCLEITDHSPCIESHNGSGLPCSGCDVPCERDNPPFGDWATYGISAEDSANVYLHDLNIHGLAAGGVHAGRIRDWKVEHVRIHANGSVGWDGDLWDDEGDDSSGDLEFRQVEISFNGCGETWPGKAVDPDTCWGQEAGGYGDGFATGYTGGHWLFEDCYVHHNTSDGVDMLYVKGDSSIEVRRLVSEGNAGNQLKTGGPAWIENSLLISNCSFFDKSPLMAEGDLCRAGGSAFSVDLHRGDTVTMFNSTVTGQGDCLVDAGCNDSMSDDSDPNCNGTERLIIRNTLFDGNTDWRQSWEKTCLVWYDDSLLPTDPLDMDFNLVWQTKDNPCPGSKDICNKDPKILNANMDTYNGHLRTGSPAVDRGTTSQAPSEDLDEGDRDPKPDIGAYELSAAGMSPSITKISAASGSGGFQLRVRGSRFQSGLTAFVDGDFAAWTNVTYVSPSEVLLGGGESLKARFPLGVPVRVTIVSPGGGTATANYMRK